MAVLFAGVKRERKCGGKPKAEPCSILNLASALEVSQWRNYKLLEKPQFVWATINH